MSYTEKYEEVFDYLRAPTLPHEALPTVVFGRQDAQVAVALGDLIVDGLVSKAVITGGIGKNSGNLLAQGYRSEAHYLLEHLIIDSHKRDYARPMLGLDEEASNGGENGRNSLTLLTNMGADTSKMTAVCHATSLRRLSETLVFETAKKTEVTPVVFRKPSDYEFNPANPVDREEAAAELLRLADWPARKLLNPQPDLPENLVDFVRDVHGKSPVPVAGWQSAILRRLPKTTQLAVINLAARHGRK